MDLTAFLQKALPWIGAAATGNVPALVTLAAKTVSDALGKPVDATSDAITQAVANASPDELMKLKQADDELKLKAQALGFSHEEEMAKIGLQEDSLVIQDVDSARKTNSGHKEIFVLAYATLIAFLVIMGCVLLGIFELLTGGIKVQDAGIVAAVAGLVGSIVGYVAANTQTVYNFIYGGSLGSRNSASGLADATKQAIQQLGK